MREELKKAILEDRLYDFLSNEGHKLSKDELIQIARQLDFSAWEMLRDDKKPEFNNKLIDNLNEYDFFEEE